MEQDEIKRRIIELQVEHRDLDDAIERLAMQPGVDELALRRMKKRNSMKAAIASSASIKKLAISSPIPKWENSAARPRPAARPAIGPIQLRF